MDGRNAWGHWKLDESDWCLHLHVPGRQDSVYRVDLERCSNSPQILDWIAQIAGKRWAVPTATVVGELVMALDDLIGLQASVCGNETDRTVDAVAVAKARMRSRPRLGAIPGV